MFDFSQEVLTRLRHSAGSLKTGTSGLYRTVSTDTRHGAGFGMRYDDSGMAASVELRKRGPQPDIMVANGVTGFREIGALTQAHHKRSIPHHGGGNFGAIAHLHAMTPWPNSSWIEILHDAPVAA